MPESYFRGCLMDENSETKSEAADAAAHAPDEVGGDSVAGKVERTVSGLVDLGGRFFVTTGAMIRRRRLFVEGLGAHSQSDALLEPFTFLILASIPGAIYYEAAARSFAAHKPYYTDVGANIVANIQRLISSDFSLVKIILLALPVIAVTAFFSRLFSLSAANAQARVRLRDATLYAFGFAMLALAFGGFLPIVLRALIPSTFSLAPGLQVVNVPLPPWATFSGVPFSLYALYSVGDILNRAANRSGGKRSGIVAYTGGIAGLFGCLLAVWIVAGTDWRFYLDAVPHHADAGPENIRCTGDAMVFSSDGKVDYSFVVTNGSDDVLYLKRDVDVWASPMFLGVPFDHRLRLHVDQWLAGSNDIMMLRPAETAWVAAHGTASPEVVARIPSGSVSGRKNTRSVKALFFKSIGKDVGCTADYWASVGERPSIFIK